MHARDNDWTRFEVTPLQLLGAGLAGAVAGINALKGLPADAHLTEDEVQVLVVNLLRPALPGPDLIQQRSKLTVNAGQDDREMPDVALWNLDRKSYWGIFEIKTLLANDNLAVPAVAKDLDKLKKYKQLHPHAACIFILVGGRSQLFSPARSGFREELPIKFTETLFNTSRRRPQLVKDFFATPCGHSSNHSDVNFFAWEIQTDRAQPAITRYDFEARMI